MSSRSSPPLPSDEEVQRILDTIMSPKRVTPSPPPSPLPPPSLSPVSPVLDKNKSTRSLLPEEFKRLCFPGKDMPVLGKAKVEEEEDDEYDYVHVNSEEFAPLPIGMFESQGTDRLSIARKSAAYAGQVLQDAAISATFEATRAIQRRITSLTQPVEVDGAMGETEKADLNFIGFNQDNKALAIGHHDGYATFDLKGVLEAVSLAPQYTSPLNGSKDQGQVTDVLLVERMFSSSLLAIVSRKNPRVVLVYHFANNYVIRDLKFSSSVLNVKMNRDRLVVCLEDCIHIHNIRDTKVDVLTVLHTICDTPLNRTGMIDLSSCENPSLLAYPGSTTNGQVNMFDAKSLQAVNSFMAHENPLSALRFNAEGSKIATASVRGTVIRVFSVPNGVKLFEFQRGIRQCTIHSLSFSSNSQLLCSSSNTETIHIYRLVKEDTAAASEAASTGGWYDYIQKTVQAYVPMGELMRDADFAQARLPASQRTVAALVGIDGSDHVLVASTDGYLYAFRIPVDGGACELIKQHQLWKHLEGTPGASSTPSIGVPTRPPRAGDGGSRARDSPPNTSDMDEFPPMDHTSGH